MSQFQQPRPSNLSDLSGPASSRRSADAQITTEESFLARKCEHNLVVVWAAGFNKEWSEAHRGVESVKFWMSVAESRLERELVELERSEQLRTGPFRSRLVVATHGISYGLPGIAQRVCQKLGIVTIGVASEASQLTKPFSDELIVTGKSLDDESATLSRIADKFWAFGGGELTKLEAQQFYKTHKRAADIQIHTTYGGSAGDLKGDELHAVYVIS